MHRFTDPDSSLLNRTEWEITHDHCSSHDTFLPVVASMLKMLNKMLCMMLNTLNAEASWLVYIPRYWLKGLETLPQVVTKSKCITLDACSMEPSSIPARTGASSSTSKLEPVSLIVQKVDWVMWDRRRKPFAWKILFRPWQVLRDFVRF